MIPPSNYQALVVDDEALVRQGTMRALAHSGFTCEPARNGQEAIEKARQSRYDLVVTDLRMPDGNGHKLAVDLLELPDRPAIVILTGVMEPKLYNDLRVRGVDDIMFKPVDFESLAKKGKAIVEERKLSAAASRNNGNQEEPVAKVSATTATPAAPQNLKLKSRVAEATRTLPAPPAGFDGLAAATSNAVSAKDLAIAVEADPAFVLEVVELTNSVLYASNLAVAELQRSLASLRQNPLVRSAAIFGAGMLTGSILTWLLCRLAAG